MSRALVTVIAALLAFGAWLRVDRLRTQVPFHDERHSLAAAFHDGAAEIASSFGTADHSIPATLLIHAIASAGALDELSLWAPSVAIGIAGPLLLLPLLARALDRRTAWLFAGLVAICPLLVYFSRTARPYQLSALCALAVAPLLAARGAAASRRSRALLAGCVALTVWSIPIHSPFVLGASAAALVVALRGSGKARPEAVRGAVASLLGLATGCLLLLPAALHDLPTLLAKSGSRPFGLGDLAAAGTISFGFGSPLAAALVLLVAAIGVVSALDGRARDATALLAAGATAQLAAVWLVAPAASAGSPFVVARYVLPCALVVLVLAAHGCRALADAGRRGAAAAAAGLLLFGAAIWLPSAPRLAERVDSFRSMRLYHLLFRTPREIGRAFPALPAAYAALRPEAGPGAVLEAPYDGVQRVPYPYYQNLHGREVYLGVTRGACVERASRRLPVDGEAGFHLSRLVALDDLDGLAARSIRFVVLHRRPEAEVPWLRSPRPARGFDFGACVAYLVARTGRQPLAVGDIAVFELSAPGQDGPEQERKDPG